MNNQALEREVDGLGELLKLRGNADDLSFVPQILDGLCRVVLKKFPVSRINDFSENPRVYPRLLELLKTLDSLKPQVSLKRDLPRKLQEHDWDTGMLLRHISGIATAIETKDDSPDTVARVQDYLTRFYVVTKGLVADAKDPDVANAKIGLSWGEEDDETEFKASLRTNLKTSRVDKAIEYVAVKAIAGLLNYCGGQLYVGVDDGGNPVGLESDFESLRGSNKEDALLRHFSNIVVEHIGRENYQFLETKFVDIGEMRILVVNVRQCPHPVFVKRGREESFFVRTGASTLSLNAREAIAYYVSHWPGNPLSLS